MGRPIIQSVGSFCSLQFGAAQHWPRTIGRERFIIVGHIPTLGMWGYEMKHDYIKGHFIYTWLHKFLITLSEKH